MNEGLYKELRSLLKDKPLDSNKGTNGTLTVISGSQLYRGAPYLAISSALRCGVGIARLASTEKVISSVSFRLAEPVYLPIEQTEDGGISAEDMKSKLKGIKTSAFLVGCGMTDCLDTKRTVSAVLRREEPSLIDADGLNSIKNTPELLKYATTVPIITPHIGEMARLTDFDIQYIKQNRAKTALEFSSKYNCVVVLKDYITVIASPCGELYELVAPNSGLSKGGSGDVLSGMIASFLAQGYSQYGSAKLGVLLHSLAAQIALSEKGAYSMLPSDVIDSIYKVLK